MNRFGNFLKPLTWMMAILLAAFVAGCGGGGGDGGSAAPAPAAPIGDIAGVWTIIETGMVSSDPACEPPANPTVSYQVTVTQPGSGNDLTVLDATNPEPTGTSATFPGTLKGDQLTWTGSFPERGGVTTWTSVLTTVAPGCNSAAGTYNWSYVQDAPGTITCTGSTTFTGTADIADGCAPPASAS